ncbi:MAG: spore coat protein CotJC [Lachnospiraceae bacterium]|nr:spore coat protein CotJC [Lachnospiraceae bacterium]
MWKYEKRLQYPVNISMTNPKLAQVIISQFGGPDGELAASQRYLAQRYTMPYKECKALLTDIGSEASEMFRRVCRAFSEANSFFSNCLSFRQFPPCGQFMLPATV